MACYWELARRLLDKCGLGPGPKLYNDRRAPVRSPFSNIRSIHTYKKYVSSLKIRRSCKKILEESWRFLVQLWPIQLCPVTLLDGFCAKSLPCKHTSITHQWKAKEMLYLSIVSQILVGYVTENISAVLFRIMKLMKLQPFKYPTGEGRQRGRKGSAAFELGAELVD